MAGMDLSARFMLVLRASESPDRCAPQPMSRILTISPWRAIAITAGALVLGMILLPQTFGSPALLSAVTIRLIPAVTASATIRAANHWVGVQADGKPRLRSTSAAESAR